MIPLVGFLAGDDPRVRGTVEAIERELMVDGFVRRYRTETDVDGLPPGEGVFLPCTFWLADNLALQGRRDEAARSSSGCSRCATTSACSPRSTTRARRLLGNFPQAFTHVGLVNTAWNLALGEEM